MLLIILNVIGIILLGLCYIWKRNFAQDMIIIFLIVDVVSYDVTRIIENASAANITTLIAQCITFILVMPRIKLVHDFLWGEEEIDNVKRN